MDMATFLAIEQVAPGRYRVPVGRHLVTPGEFLYGGCGLAACVQALELETGRPLRWATGQFTSYAAPGDVLDLEVEVAATGRNVTQARVRALVNDREVLMVMGALGGGSHTVGAFVTKPEVRAPLDCPRREAVTAVADTLFSVLEIRTATGRGWKELDGTPGSPESSFWIRIPDHLEPSAATLSVYGDSVANGVLQVTGRPMMGRSLDNTLRIADLAPTEWVLVDIRMQAYFEGFTQGEAYLWAEDGSLLAIASQTQTIKPRSDADGKPWWGGRPPSA